MTKAATASTRCFSMPAAHEALAGSCQGHVEPLHFPKDLHHAFPNAVRDPFRRHSSCGDVQAMGEICDLGRSAEPAWPLPRLGQGARHEDDRSFSIFRSQKLW